MNPRPVLPGCVRFRHAFADANEVPEGADATTAVAMIRTHDRAVGVAVTEEEQRSWKSELAGSTGYTG